MHNQIMSGNQLMGPNGESMSGMGPPSTWQSFLNGLQRVVECFGRMSFLVDENAQAIHFFISALLQLLDRVGSLYGETARLALRILGYRKPKSKKSVVQDHHQQGPRASQHFEDFDKSSLSTAWKEAKK